MVAERKRRLSGRPRNFRRAPQSRSWSRSSCLRLQMVSRKGIGCHGNTCPIILLAENHLSANLAGTHPFHKAKLPLGFFASSLTRSSREEVEKQAGDSGHERGSLWAGEPFNRL